MADILCTLTTAEGEILIINKAIQATYAKVENGDSHYETIEERLFFFGI